MTEPGIEFPLSLRPVVRSRQPRDQHGSFVPYHAAIWIVDATGRRIVDVAPDLDDLRGGRNSEDAHALVNRASRMVGWLERVHARLAALTAPLDPVPQLLARPFLSVSGNDRTAEIGVQLLSSENEEFDRLSRRVDLFASEAAVDAIVDLLSGRLARRYAAAAETLEAVREAIDAWRSTEEVAASGTDPVVIDDVRLEY
jgi:hypothetical protein